MTLQDRIAGAVLGAFTADALCLGVHWIYKPEQIARAVERLEGPIDPLPGAKKWHKNRSAGQFTHYGDQLLVLLQSVTETGAWNRDDFATRWRAMWQGYDGWVDGATKDTLTVASRGTWPDATGSTSNDLAGASRMAGLLPALADADVGDWVRAVREQTVLTHGDPELLEAADFFAYLVHAVLHGASVEEAIGQALDHPYPQAPIREWLDEARARLDDGDAGQVVADLGATCHVQDAVPATLYLLLRHQDDPREAQIANAMAGGDSSARGMLIGMILGARDGLAAVDDAWVEAMEAGPRIRRMLGLPVTPPAGSSKFTFENADGLTLAGALEAPPEGEDVHAYAVFAHCFTCGKDVAAASRIARALAAHGIATLRFDFTGLGSSDGDFANTDFSSNVADLVAAADALREQYAAPTLLVGHSLGGAAVLAAAHRIEEVAGVVTIGAPSDPAHVERLLSGSREEIEREGKAEVTLAGRSFTIGRQFLEDLREQEHRDAIRGLGRALLIMHSPEDEIVPIDEAGRIFTAARHPKSFVSLDPADHLLSKREDAKYAAAVIAAWAGRLVGHR
jgi:ADP-ribosylglycohydrolase/pimeloyl-ACP methyl ester carboxylesterase